jgi:uncharacterized protein
MSPQEKDLIVQLFERLRAAASAPRDPEAESFIRSQMSQQPYAPYAMAQTIVAQNQALAAAQERIRQLEADAPEPAYYGREAESGFGGQGYGGSDRYAGSQDRPMGAPGSAPMGAPRPSGSPWAVNRQSEAPAAAPWGGNRMAPGQMAPGQMAAPQQGGGFLAGAMQTALGVAGGAMLFSGVSSLFGGNEAKAAEPAAAADSGSQADDQGDAGDAGDGGDGGWMSDMFGGDDGGGDGGEW